MAKTLNCKNMPTDLLARIKEEATEEGISQKALIITALECYLSIWQNITVGS